MAHIPHPGGPGGAGGAGAVPLGVWPVAQSAAQEEWQGYHLPAGRRRGMGPELARRIVATYSSAGGLVVDPVCGLGVVVVEAARLGRRSVGVAGESRAALLVEARLRRVMTGSRRGCAEVRVAGPSYPCGSSAARALGDLAAQADLVASFPSPSGGRGRLPALPVALLAACFGVLRPGGLLVVVTRHVHRRGRLVDAAAAAAAAARRAGFVYLEHVIAVDAAVADGRLTPTPGKARTSAAAGRASRGERRLHRLVHHDVLVFTKPRGEATVAEPPAPVWASVWPTAQRPAAAQRRGRYVAASTGHPAKMLPAIAAEAVARFTAPGELVFDPMCGVGTTLVEAVYQGRDALGVECEPQWAWLSRANVRHARARGATGTGRVVDGDARGLPHLVDVDAQARGRVALVVTSPPYGRSVHGQVRARPGEGVAKWSHRYGHNGSNLAYRGLGELLAGLVEIFAGCRALLRPGGTMVVTVRPWRQRGELIDFPALVAQAAEDAGLVLAERLVALLAGLRGDQLVPRASFFQLQQVRKARERGIPLHVIAHEDVLVLRPLQTGGGAVAREGAG